MSSLNPVVLSFPIPDPHYAKSLPSMVSVEANIQAQRAREDAWLRANGHSHFADQGNYARQKLVECVALLLELARPVPTSKGMEDRDFDLLDHLLFQIGNPWD